MGLDIYIHKRKRVEKQPTIEELKEGLASSLMLIKNVEMFDADYINEFIEYQQDKFGMDKEVGYFRKVNFLYAYFQDRLEDEGCEVTKEDLNDIIAKCKEVLEKHDEETSKKLLPTCDGFFFGSTDYDDYYYADVQNVMDKATEILANLHKDEELSIYFSW